MSGMRVGVIDVGSNTVRLLVATVGSGHVRTVREERTHLGLGEELLRHGRIRRRKLDEVADVTGDYARIARKLGVRELETVVTAPGRQGDEPARLLDVLGRATAGEVRVVSAEEEGRLAFEGAVSRADTGESVVAVCDVGGGSTELVVGTQLLGPAWVRSVDLGSLRLTAALLPGDPPSRSRDRVGARGRPERARRARPTAPGARARHRRQRPCGRPGRRSRIRRRRPRASRRAPRSAARGRERQSARAPCRPRPHPACGSDDPGPGLAPDRDSVCAVARRDPRREPRCGWPPAASPPSPGSNRAARRRASR